VLLTQAVYGAMDVVFLRMTESLVQVVLHLVKIAREKIQGVSIGVNNILLEIHLRKIVIRAHAMQMVRLLAR